MENLRHLNLWAYLQKRYGAEISYSDSGWRFKFGGEVSKDGHVQTGLTKARMKIRNDPKAMNLNIQHLCEAIYGRMLEHIQNDSILREKLAAMKVQARRKARG